MFCNVKYISLFLCICKQNRHFSLCTEMLYGSSITGCEADGTTLRTNTSAEESGDSFSQAQESQSDNCSLQNLSATPSITRVPSQVFTYCCVKLYTRKILAWINISPLIDLFNNTLCYIGYVQQSGRMIAKNNIESICLRYKFLEIICYPLVIIQVAFFETPIVFITFI